MMIDPKHIKPLAWTALISGILCWLLSSIILVGLDVIAVITGFLVIKQVKDKNQHLRAPLKTIFYCKITLWPAPASDFTKSPQRSALATFPVFLLIFLGSAQIEIFRYEHSF